MITKKQLDSAVINASFNMWKALGAKIDETEDLVVIRSGTAYSLFNRAIIRDPAAFETSKIDKVIASFGTIPHSWMVYGHPRQEELAIKLREQQFAPIATFPGMLIDLDTFLGTFAARENNEKNLLCEVKPLCKNDDPKDWQDMFKDSWNWPKEVLQRFVDLHWQNYQKPNSPFIHFKASINGSILSGGSLLLDRSVAGIYNVATRSSAQGKGIASQLLCKILEEAQRRGYSHACLISFPRAERLYARLGFRTTCHFQIFAPVLDQWITQSQVPHAAN
jgi:ribosomal protein S18 acetylase RimI-like enzyme